MKENKMSTSKAIITVFLGILILFIAQNLSALIGNFIINIGSPREIGNLAAGVLYPILTYVGIKLWVTKFLKQELKDFRIPKFKLKPIWCIVAIFMPCCVSAILILTGGQWKPNSMSTVEIWETIIIAIFYYGIATGIVEEMIFRGLIMGALEYRWNKYIGIILPSVIFGVLHVIGSDLSFASFIQLLIAGSIVGIMFSFVTCESDNIWNSAIIHAAWNTIIIGGILHIGDTADEYSVHNFVLKSKSFFITGGDFGIEASAVAIIFYALVILLAFFLMKKQK